MIQGEGNLPGPVADDAQTALALVAVDGVMQYHRQVIQVECNARRGIVGLGKGQVRGNTDVRRRYVVGRLGKQVIGHELYALPLLYVLAYKYYLLHCTGG